MFLTVQHSCYCVQWVPFLFFVGAPYITVGAPNIWPSGAAKYKTEYGACIRHCYDSTAGIIFKYQLILDSMSRLYHWTCTSGFSRPPIISWAAPTQQKNWSAVLRGLFNCWRCRRRNAFNRRLLLFPLPRWSLTAACQRRSRCTSCTMWSCSATWISPTGSPQTQVHPLDPTNQARATCTQAGRQAGTHMPAGSHSSTHTHMHVNTQYILQAE